MRRFATKSTPWWQLLHRVLMSLADWPEMKREDSKMQSRSLGED